MNSMPKWRIATAVHNGYVEIFGLCGAGKTSVAQKLLLAVEPGAEPWLRPEGPVAPSGWISVLTAGRLFMTLGLRDPSACMRLLSNSAGRWLILKLGYRVAGLRKRGNIAGSLLLDSGVLQPLISFEVEYNLSFLQIDALGIIKNLPLPSCAIYVKVEPGVAMRRYLGREKENGRTIYMRNIEMRFTKGFDMAERLYRACEDMGVNCVVYNNDIPLTRNGVSQILKML